MYLPTHFSEARPDVLRAFVREHPLGLLVTQSRAGGIDANSVPFFLDAGRIPLELTECRQLHGGCVYTLYRVCH